MTTSFASAEELAEAIVRRVGPNVVLGLPVGIGKALHVANALYRRAAADPSLRLTIFTGLTLTRPTARSALEARLLDPIAERLYGRWPPIDYAEALESGSLPGNIEVREFYLRPGAYLRNAIAQQNYTSINYSRVARELLDMGVNVVAQLVAVDPDGSSSLSLACNPEITLDLLPAMRALHGTSCALVGQLNSALPYMPGDALLPRHQFDFLLEHPEVDYPLFPLPNRRVTPADYAIGMHVASLVPDGGTLQIGIGSLSDAVAHCLRLRHERPDVFRAVLEQLPGGLRAPGRRDLPVEDRPFATGLYACTELLSDALFALLAAGIVRRPADEDDDTLVHAGFFLGSAALYAGLRELPPDLRRRISMTRISRVNTLFGDEARKRRQRRQARFINETMMATLLGAAVSDALGDGRVVSGIGGQFDFVTMAADLDEAHSVLMLRARRESNGELQSNIRWSYSHTSVPRQSRDLFVTEYGIAATRGRPDAAVIDAMLRLADAGFQGELLAAARSARKVPADYRPDESVRDNRPETITRIFSASDMAGLFPPYPLGTDLDPNEQKLADALGWLQQATATPGGRIATLCRALAAGRGAEHAGPLERMRLGRVAGLREWIDRRLVALALDKTG